MLSQPPIWLILVAFVCALGPLVFIHEFGHYLVARWFGVGAETFSIGFGREITGWTDKRGTRWKVGWLPLGGYVKFVGDEHEASAPGDLNKLTPEERERSFHFKPIWQRFLIVLAGPMSNFILAILIFAIFFAAFGAPRTPPVVNEIEPGSPAATAQIQQGDRILSIGGRDTPTFEELRNYIVIRPGENVTVRLEREQEIKEIQVTLGTDIEKDRFGQSYKRGLLGVSPVDAVYEPVPAIQLIPTATAYVVKLTRTMLVALWQIITGRRSVKELGGPLKIAQIAGQQATLGLIQFVSLVALLSINLGFINLLPVPVLDGGHLLFYGIEAVRRKPVSPEAQDWAFRGGLAFILALLIFTTVNDLGSFGLWERLGRLIG
ncbi:RIP metalloprotease RseP [Sphingomonas daechungensis]|uniref:Zinc metalloprotease n=1 Tax=Sphingomonas daechungensis TaxID=1176646 RepID=A0ABX6T4L2_9SPHN|nr:RIP metalloprotease RseP [Sphingomonas daechungensis]QNP42588.1 RIP metalloprotease RseP [Sphingomonas daechungensis]